jgi:hypothetical protein
MKKQAIFWGLTISLLFGCAQNIAYPTSKISPTPISTPIFAVTKAPAPTNTAQPTVLDFRVRLKN